MTSDSESRFWEKLKSRCSQQAAQGAERLVGSAAPMLIKYPKKPKTNQRPSVIGLVQRGDVQPA